MAMKRILALIFLLFIGTRILAQNSYSLSMDTTKVSDNISNIQTGGNIAAIVNLTVSTFSLRITSWKRTNVVLPAGWTTGVCDLSLCYGSAVSSHFFSVKSDTTGQITLDFYPTSSGYAVTTLHLYDSLNHSDGVTATFIADISGATGIENIFKVKNIYLSPVPTKENLSVVYDASLNPTKVEIYNVLGQMMKTVKIVNDGTSKVDISLSGLEKGLYFLRVYPSDNKVLTRQFSKD